MEREERKILEIEQQLNELALEEQYTLELNQDIVNQQIKEGLLFIHNQLYEMKEINFFDHFSIMIPSYFKEMRSEFIKRKYPNENRPYLVYTNYATTVNLTFSQTMQEVKANQFEKFVYNTVDTIKRVHPESCILSDGIIENSGTEFGYFDFITPAFDNEVYNYFFLFRNNERVLFSNVNCPVKDKGLWRTVAYGMMCSMKDGRETKEVKGE